LLCIDSGPLINILHYVVCNSTRVVCSSGSDLCWRLGDERWRHRGSRIWEGVSPSLLGERSDCHLPRKIFDFLAQKGELWYILGATFAVELNGNWLGYWMACTAWGVLGGHEACRPPSEYWGRTCPPYPLRNCRPWFVQLTLHDSPWLVHLC